MGIAEAVACARYNTELRERSIIDVFVRSIIWPLVQPDYIKDLGRLILYMTFTNTIHLSALKR